MIGRTSPLDPNELEQAFRRHAKSLDVSCAAAPSRFIAIDGKTLRQSFDAFADRKAAHVLSAFAVDHRIILAHEVIDEKSNEIPTAQALIAAMGLSDASSRSTPCTSKKTFEIARETGNELIVQVKLISRVCCNAASTSPRRRLQSPSTTGAIWREIARTTGGSKSMLPAPPSMTTNGRR